MAKRVKSKLAVQVYVRDRFKCVWCGVRLSFSSEAEPGKRASLDHLIPRKHGGRDSLNNLVASCFSCNSSRGAGDWEGFGNKAARKYIHRKVRPPLINHADFTEEQIAWRENRLRIIAEILEEYGTNT